MTVEQLLAEFLQTNPEFLVKLKSSAEDIDNLLSMQDFRELLYAVYHEGFSSGYDKGYSETYDEI